MDINEVFVTPSNASLYFMYLFSEEGSISYTKGLDPAKPYKSTTLTVMVDPNKFAKETSLEDYMGDMVRSAFFMTVEASNSHKTLNLESGDIVVLASAIEKENIQKFAIKFQDIYDVTDQPMVFKFKLKTLEGELVSFKVGCFNDPTEVLCKFSV